MVFSFIITICSMFPSSVWGGGVAAPPRPALHCTVASLFTRAGVEITEAAGHCSHLVTACSTAVSWSQHAACSTAVSWSPACSLLSSCHYSVLQYEAGVQSVQQYEAGVQRAARVLSLTESCGAARCAAVRPGTGQLGYDFVTNPAHCSKIL